jgi:hypothetical protein
MKANLIAPCGMNCGICMAFLREKNRCPGCRSLGVKHPKCRIRNCADMNGRYCFSCSGFPCRLLKNLDKRYRKKYGMSMIENLESIRAVGIRKFVTSEKERWACPGCGGTINVHRHCCSICGARVPPRSYD